MKTKYKVLSMVILLLALVILLPLLVYWLVEPHRKVGLPLNLLPSTHVVLPPEGTLYHGPAFVGGDVTLPDGTEPFSYYNVLTEPGSTTGPFGRQVWTHEAGFMAVLNGTRQIIFYYIDLSGALIKQQTVDLPFDVYYGQFAPWFNVPNEVYYLFLSGRDITQPADQDGSSWKTGPQGNLVQIPPNALYVISYAVQPRLACQDQSWPSTCTSTCNPNVYQWLFCKEPVFTSSQIPGRTREQGALSGVTTFDEYFIGTLGELFRVVLDDNSSQLKQSIYIRGTAYHAQEPGGGLYWFVLTDNRLRPTLELVQSIFDSRLSWAANFSNHVVSPAPPPFPVTAPNLLNGFGSHFFVQTGLGDENLLLVGNPSAQDNATLYMRPVVTGDKTYDTTEPRPNGYVQTFVLQDFGQGKLWQAPISLNTLLPNGIADLELRYPFVNNPTVANTIRGFGYSVFYDDTRLITVPQQGQYAFVIYQDGNINSPPYDMLNSENQCQSHPITTTPMDNVEIDVTTDINLYRRGLTPLSNTTALLVSNGARIGGVVCKYVALSGADPKYTSEKDVSAYDCFIDLKTFGNQLLNDNTPLNSGWPQHIPNATQGFLPASFVGPGQSICTLSSRTGLTHFLVFNDPMYEDTTGKMKGRIVIFVQSGTL